MFTHMFGYKVLIFLLLLILFLNFKDNLTAEEKATVWSLKNNKDIIIKQTDKDGTLLLLLTGRSESSSLQTY